MESNGAKKFSSGFLDCYEPQIKRVQKSLMDLTTRQSLTLNEIEEENFKFNNVNIAEVNNLFMLIKAYQLRLMNVKKEMVQLSEKSSELKRRALRLQEFKQKEALEKAHYREAQLKREQDLIARPTSKTQQTFQSK